ncbi:MAG TPA: ABC transporter ATP-binding protein [Stellaceae bacterium]|nr:ABC transporter ATP-binding protein [Stellaceae bacterium]
MQLEIEDLHIGFPGPRGFAPAVRGVSFAMGAEKLGIVGESGSGKSLTARAILRLTPPNAVLRAKRLRFDDIDVLSASPRALGAIRGRRAGLILQDPKFALNPVMTAGEQVAEPLRLHKGLSRRAARAAAVEMLAQVRINDPAAVAHRYPHELSGGMGQRVMIAMMLAGDPELLIADEATSALDATVQAEILRLIEDLVSRRGMGLILISHDLPLVSHFCDRVLVMYAGRVVEAVPAAELRKSRHPYTQGLLLCPPSLMRPRARLPVLARQPDWAEVA